ncbi:MAG TPA: serine hydrolase domain-containing protein [Candidatus Tectomicrobia bacterium]|nr:serine hydrolase domain-containing protein [Candidatus Tectomicrobia bacterium]
MTAGSLRDDHDVRSSIDALVAWIESRMAYTGLPGCAVAIVHDQTLVWAAGLGLADVERRTPVTASTLFRIASITKLFTATALLQLRDAGRLGLDDPLARHLPWFAVRSRHADAPPITIRHLLTHTAGLSRESGSPYWTDGEFPTAAALREALPGLEAVLPPETRWKYSNLALALAGEVVSAVSGEPYADYVRRHVLEPLGMRDTFVATPPRDDPRLATGYGRRLPGSLLRPRAPFSDTQGLIAAANMTTSVTDLACFAMLQFRDGPAGGAQVLRGSTLREMQRVHWLAPDWRSGWGLGFQVEREDGHTYVGHGGALRGFRTRLRIRPADRIAVICFTNADDGDPLTIAQKAFAWVAPSLAARAPADEPRAAPDPGWARYTGRYRSAWADAQVLVVRGRLMLIDPTLPDPLAEPSTLVPVGEHTFRIDTPNGFGAHGELVVFELGGDERVARVKIGDNYAEPVEAW